VLMPTPVPRSAPAAPFRSLEDSKHAYYQVFDVEIEVTGKSGALGVSSACGAC